MSFSPCVGKQLASSVGVGSSDVVVGAIVVVGSRVDIITQSESSQPTSIVPEVTVVVPSSAMVFPHVQ